MLEELHGDGVDTQWSVRKRESASAVTHIIVDEETNSRTCIHAAMSVEISEADVRERWASLWTGSADIRNSSSSHSGGNSNIDLVHLDSRQTLAAIQLAQLANGAGVPVSIDLEKPRPHLQELLPLCDLLFTNQHFPHIFHQTPSSPSPSPAVR